MAEEHIQQRIFDDPTVINKAWADPEDVPRWVFAVYEMPVHIDEQQKTKNDLFLDILLVDDEAVPTLVETKLSSNIEIRRTIVGQILEYATFARSWDIDNLRWDYEHPDSAHINIKVIAPISDPDVFWSKLRKNLKEGCMTLMLAADDFPTETEEVAKFLHCNTRVGLEVLAYAPKDFAGLAAHQRQARTQQINRSHQRHQARSRDHDPVSTNEEFVTADPILEAEMTISKEMEWEGPLASVRAMIPEEHRPTIQRLLGLAKRFSAEIYWRGDAITIRASTDGRYHGNQRGLITVAWIWPKTQNRTQWYGSRDVTFGYEPGQLNLRSDDPLRQSLESYIAEFEGDDFGARGTQRYRGRVLFFSEVTAESDLLCERLEKVLKNLRGPSVE